MEMIIYFNIICFAVLTLKMETTKNQVVVAYTSIVITSALLLSVIMFHVYRYAGLFSTTKRVKTFMVKLLVYKKKHHYNICRLPDHEDSQPPITHSVVEIPGPNLEQQESAIQEENKNTPITSCHVMVVDVEAITTAPQTDSEEADTQSTIEAAEMNNTSPSAQFNTTTEFDNEILVSPSTDIPT